MIYFLFILASLYVAPLPVAIGAILIIFALPEKVSNQLIAGTLIWALLKALF